MADGKTRAAVALLYGQRHTAYSTRGSLGLEASSHEEAHGAPVRRHDVGFQAIEANVPRRPDQTFQQERADASALIGIDHANPQFRRRPAVRQCHVAPVAHDGFQAIAADSSHHQSDVPYEIRLSKIAQLVVTESMLDAEEPMVARIGTQSVEVTREPLLVVGANCPNTDGSAIVQNRIR